MTQIAAYLLQREIVNVTQKLEEYFSGIYAPLAGDPGREWPPRVPSVAKFQRSEYPTFANILVHVNGATVERHHETAELRDVADLVFDENSSKLNFSVIDGQHRVNAAYLAVRLLQEEEPNAKWEIPAEVFIDLDRPGEPPRRQAQIFIDVNFYQKKVDRSLVADLFPTARGKRAPLDEKERAQDLGRRLMLEVGPLVGMIQIPGIKFGVKDVVTLATLNSAVEDVLADLYLAGIETLDAQAEFLAQCLDAWLDASGRRQDLDESESLDPENVAYQGRVIVSFLTLTPACIWELKKKDALETSSRARAVLTRWLSGTIKRARLAKDGKFLARGDFKAKGFLGSGGLARFRDTLWLAATSRKRVSRMKTDRLSALAAASRAEVRKQLRNT